MIDDWPTKEEQQAAIDRGCTCGGTEWKGDPVHSPGRDALCVVHGSTVIMRATIDKLRSAIGEAFVKRFLG